MDNLSLLLIPIAISLGTLALAAYNTRKKAESDYVNILERRVEDLELRMVECEKTRDELARRNLDLNQQNVDILKKFVESTLPKK
jgi:hypothetical protein